MPDPPVDPTLADEPVELLRHLVRFDTSNPPGNERACVEWIEALLGDAGFETETYADVPDRPNLVARLPADGDASPLLLYGHVDVVPVNPDDWTYPPFDAVVDDGQVWGRGTLDMKGGVAMMVAAAIRAAQEERPLAGDLLVMILSDEEAGGTHGASYMVDEHPEIFADVEFALGEFGGFPLEVAGERFYPIQLTEKTVCWSELTFHGAGGHGSLPRRESAMVDMARAVEALSRSRLPVHVVPTVETMIETMADEIGGEAGDTVRALVESDRTNEVLDGLGEAGVMLDALLHDTANPTVVRGGDSPNVIPSEVSLTLDCRLLPGRTPADLEAELRDTVPEGVDFDFEPIRHDPVPEDTDRALFDLLADVLESADPTGRAIPFTLFAGTDGRHLARAGVQSYGFTPMKLPSDIDFLDAVHGADEHIPVEAVPWGTDLIGDVIDRYAGRPS